MSRKIAIFLLFIGAFATTVAVADPPECVGPPDGGGPPGHAGPPDGAGPPEGAGPPAKVVLLHCGCADDGNRMEYVEIQVSSRSKGHRFHEAGSIDSCSDGTDSFRDFVRSGSDCQLDGPALGDDIQSCTD
jgi:hypothetical protein